VTTKPQAMRMMYMTVRYRLEGNGLI